MKIALFTYSTKARGSVIHTLELAEALHELGHQVCVFALSKDGQMFDYPLSCQCQLIPSKPAAIELDALIHQRIQEFVDALSQSDLDYDCYHAQDCISANALAALVQRQHIPHFVRTVHHIEDYSSPYLQQCQDRSIRAATLCLCVSDRWQIELKTHYRIRAERVNNGINLKRFSSLRNGLEAELKARFGVQGSPVFLSIGGIEPRKNSIRLLQAFALVLQQIPNAQLAIAGGSTLFDYHDYRDEFFALATDLNIESALVLPGIVSDAELSALYRIADVFVFPSVKEGWGLVVMEAIASGLPVITSNQAPFTEFLSPDQALLVNPNSTEAIAQAMHLVLQPGVAQSLVQKSQSVLLQYSWKASAERHLLHYRNLIESASNSIHS